MCTATLLNVPLPPPIDPHSQTIPARWTGARRAVDRVGMVRERRAVDHTQGRAVEHTQGKAVEHTHKARQRNTAVLRAPPGPAFLI